MLASLHGRSILSVEKLATLTFVEPKTLIDLLLDLQDRGFCELEGEGDAIRVCGTKEGTERVKHLFDLGKTLEETAHSDFTDEEKTLLKRMLLKIIGNTKQLVH